MVDKLKHVVTVSIWILTAESNRRQFRKPMLNCLEPSQPIVEVYLRTMDLKRFKIWGQYSCWRWDSVYQRQGMSKQALVGYGQAFECFELLKARARTNLAEIAIGSSIVLFSIRVHPYVELGQNGSDRTDLVE